MGWGISICLWNTVEKTKEIGMHCICWGKALYEKLQMIFRFMPYANAWPVDFTHFVRVKIHTWRLIYINKILMELTINTNLYIFATAHTYTHVQSHLPKFPHFEYCFTTFFYVRLFLSGFGSCSFNSSIALLLFFSEQLF